MTKNNEPPFPPLPLDAWEESKDTLHLYAQVIGKIRLGLMPRRNHWWHVPFYVSTRGFGSGPIPYADYAIAFDFDFLGHALHITTTRGESKHIALRDNLSVASFYRIVFDQLKALDIEVSIQPHPYKTMSEIPFLEDHTHASYDPVYVQRYWRVLSQADLLLKTFAARFYGKVSPVHLFWHSFDLAVTLFNGKAAPPMPDADAVTQDAYAAEVVSFGWWPGDANTRAPAFYSYTAPEPKNLRKQPLKPGAAMWIEQGSGSLAVLPYDAIREEDDPRALVLEFLQSAYDAGTTAAGWDRDAFAYPHAPKAYGE